MEDTVHGTAVTYASRGFLIRGPSGSGKSLLAASLILRGGVLVGDDRVNLSAQAGKLMAKPTPPLEGLIEIRGRGLLAIAYESSTHIAAVLDIIPAASLERYPEEHELSTEILGIKLVRQPIPDRLEHALILVESLCGKLGGSGI